MSDFTIFDFPFSSFTTRSRASILFPSALSRSTNGVTHLSCSVPFFFTNASYTSFSFAQSGAMSASTVSLSAICASITSRMALRSDMRPSMIDFADLNRFASSLLSVRSFGSSMGSSISPLFMNGLPSFIVTLPCRSPSSS